MRWFALIAALLWLAGCSSDSLTEVVVIIEAEPRVLARSNELSIHVTSDPDSGGAPQLNHSNARWHDDGTYTLALSPANPKAPDHYRVEATALSISNGLSLGVTARLASGYIAGETLYVRLLLEDVCLNVSCEANSTCHDGACVPASVNAAGFGLHSDTAPSSTDLLISTDPVPRTPSGDAGARLLDGGTSGSGTPRSLRDATIGDGGLLGAEPVAVARPAAGTSRSAPPTTASASSPGPYTVAAYDQGYTVLPGYTVGTIYYPFEASGALPYVVIVDGFLSYQANIAAWGPFLASHGIVTMTLSGKTMVDRPPERALALWDGVGTLRAEHERVGGPLFGALDPTRFGIMGWNMGGGGALIAGAGHPDASAVVALDAWDDPGATFPTLTVPTLFVAAEKGALSAALSQPMYESMPATTSKLLWERAGADDFSTDPADESGALGRYVLAWLKVFVQGDEAYRAFLREKPPNASDYKSNLL